MPVTKWEVTLNTGERIIEGEGDWGIKVGERLPWARLCIFLEENSLFIDKLDINIDGKIVHMPTGANRFNLINREPRSYSIMYTMEVDNVLAGGDIGHYLNAICHYADYDLHYLVNTENGEDWILISDSQETIAESPRKY